MATFYVPAVNLIGKGVVNEVGPYVKELGYSKALLVTDKFIESSDILPKILKPLDDEGIAYVIFSDVEPNPTCKNVMDGVAALKEHNCDFIISVGGGSPQDAASCISVIATNGGKPQDYEGLHKSAQKVFQLSLSILLQVHQQKLPLTTLSLMKNVRLKW